jgi:hypothetical protein
VLATKVRRKLVGLGAVSQTHTYALWWKYASNEVKRRLADEDVQPKKGDARGNIFNIMPE